MLKSANPKMTTRRIEFLRNVSLFQELSDAELEPILADLRPKEYSRDETVFSQGDDSHALYLVFKGKVRIFRVSPAGNETSIAIFAQHDVIGEQGTLSDVPRNATAKSIGASTLLVMSQEHFQYHLENSPRLALRLAKLLSQKLSWTAAFAESVAQFDAAGRLLHMFLIYVEQYGNRIEDSDDSDLDDGKEVYELDLSLNQTDLASMVGARREWINRILGDWRKRELLEYANGKLTILDMARVKAERDSRIEANVVDPNKW